MKRIYTLLLKSLCTFMCIFFLTGGFNSLNAQNATAAIPIGLGTPCGSKSIIGDRTNDSIKYFKYNATTNVLTAQSLCKPVMSSGPSFWAFNSGVSFNPFDGYLYYAQSVYSGVSVNTYAYRWLPNTCPNSSAIYKTFINQAISNVEFDPATGLGYQTYFVDTAGTAPITVDGGFGIQVGQFSSQKIVNGNPAIAYYDVTNLDLKYVRANDASGSSWGTPVTIQGVNKVGQYVSLLVVNGNPAISYYDATAKKLMYVRANNANGTSWATPVTADASATTGPYTSMAIVNGKPAISYYDVTNTNLKYVQAGDANGTVWGTPVTIDGAAPAITTGQYTSLMVINGNPAIAYYDVTNTDLKYVRATDVNGATWGTPVSAEASANDVGQYASLTIINGNPAISYYDNTNGDLEYVRANDISGTSWGTPVTISSTGTVGQYTSIATVNGNPAISYYDGAGFLKYVRATDVNGATWGTPGTVDGVSGDNAGQFTSLVVVNGNPAISYYDFTYKTLKFARAKDATGDKWFSASGVYNMELQQINFITGAVGIAYPVNFGGKYFYNTSGDMVMTPGGNLLAVYDNKYMSISWKNYGTAAPITATYIDSLKPGAGNNIVGLTYSDGKLITSVYTGYNSDYTLKCNIYNEIDIITGASSPITYSAGSTIFNSMDFANITSGIGASKRLVSATENPVGSKTYDLVYEVIIKNYGGTPITNVQGYDTLTFINGAGNLLSASITSFSAPAGFTQNTGFTGVPANASLLTAGGTLSNLPGQNTITLQITCKVANINPGVVYYNQAAATATGFFGDALRDLSTNGSNPDLNQNDKPDDAGENQPTPLIFLIAAQSAPCVSLTNILYTQDFGTGTGMATTLPTATVGSGASLPTGITAYTGSATQPILTETYTLTSVAQNANTADFLPITDHTGNANGRMMVVNADVNNGLFYRGSFQTALCSNQQYSLSFYAASVGNAAYQTRCVSAFVGGFVYPRIKLRVIDGSTGLIISQLTTADITSSSWQQFGFKFVSPVSFNNIIIEMENDAAGGCGNDIALDDIQFGSCDALPSINFSAPSAGCLGSSTTFNASLNDPAALPGSKDYQWEIASSATGPWTTVGTNASSYTISPLTVANTGKYYRVIVAATGNLASVNCRYISPVQLLTAKALSAAPTGATKSANNFCSGSTTVTLGVTGGSLGDGATWKWYTGSCGGTLVGTGATINVTPLATTTYFVRAEGDCNTTTCQSVTVSTFTCTVLPIDFINFNAALQGEQVSLNWTFLTSNDISRFEIERSTNNTTFTKAGTVSGTEVRLNQEQSFGFTDNISGNGSDVFYYRIKVVGKAGEIKYSSTLMVKRNQNKTAVNVMPNPASNYATVKLFVQKESEVIVRLVDAIGKTVLVQKQKVSKGNNVIQLNNLSNYNNGVYSLQVLANDEVITHKLIISK
jgi:Ig-like domain CHU_C associated/Secretion system C-terminal sorting domain